MSVPDLQVILMSALEVLIFLSSKTDILNFRLKAGLVLVSSYIGFSLSQMNIGLVLPGYIHASEGVYSIVWGIEGS